MKRKKVVIKIRKMKKDISKCLLLVGCLYVLVGVHDTVLLYRQYGVSA